MKVRKPIYKCVTCSITPMVYGLANGGKRKNACKVETNVGPTDLLVFTKPMTYFSALAL